MSRRTFKEFLNAKDEPYDEEIDEKYWSELKRRVIFQKEYVY